MGFMDIFVTPKPAKSAPTVKPLEAPAPVVTARPPLPVSNPAPQQGVPSPPEGVPARFRDAVDSAFAQAAAPHLSVYLSMEVGFRAMVGDATTRAALALQAAVTQGHTRDVILVDVREASEALAGVKVEAEKARDAALTRDAVALETEMQEARTRAQALRDEAAALDTKAAALSVEAATARAEIEASFRGICAYIETKNQELLTIERTLGGKP